MADCTTKKKYILLVGEGNFSFSAAFVTKTESRIVATCLKSKPFSEIQLKNMALVQKHGGIIFTDVDATCVAAHPEIQKYMYHVIIFNFPHINGKMKIGKNRSLLQNFFFSAEKMLASNGEIHVTLCKGQSGTLIDNHQRKWQDSWQIVALASVSNLILKDVKPFDVKQYPGYVCSGYRGTEKCFNTEGAMTYVFCRGNSVKGIELFMNEVPKVNPENLLPVQLRIFINESIEKLNAIMNDSNHPLNKVLSVVADETRKTCCVQLNSLSHCALFCSHHQQHVALCNSKLPEILFHSSCKIAAFKCFVDEAIAQFDNKDTNAVVTNASCCLCYTSLKTLTCSEPCILLYSKTYAKSVYVLKSILDSIFAHPENDVCMAFDESELDVKDSFSESGNPEFLKFLSENFTEPFCELLNQFVMKNVGKNEQNHLPQSAFSTREGLKIIVTYSTTVEDGYVLYNKVKFSFAGQNCVYNENSAFCIGSLFQFSYNGDMYSCVILNIANLAQIKYNILDKRILYDEQAHFVTVRNYVTRNVFRTVALYPPCYIHDTSFWISESFSEINLLLLVKNSLTNIVSEVSLIDSYLDSNIGRQSLCYRFIYCALNQPLSKERARDIHNNFTRKILGTIFAVELR